MSKKILIIDDAEHFVDMINIRLRNYGYNNLLVARNGQEGLNIVETDRPQLVALGTRLADVNGFDLCKKIKSIHGYSPSVILMTSMAEKLNKKQAQEALADEYIVKTFDGLSLIVAIKKLLAKIDQDA